MAIKKATKAIEELEFKASKANANIHSATSENDTIYKLYNSSDKGWTVKADGEIIASNIKGYARAVDAANKHVNETDDEQEQEEEVKPTRVTRNTPPVKPASTPAAKPVARVKKVPEFDDYDTWLENQEPRVKVGRGKESIEDYSKRTGKLAYGRAKAAYNRANGIPSATAKAANDGTAKVSTPRVVKEKAEPVSKEDTYGPMWNDFREHLGDPDPVKYALAQLTNARASRDYSILHGLEHPHMAIARNSYYKAAERCYTSEARLEAVCEKEGKPLPKGIEFEYYGVPLSEVDETEQMALSGYIEYYEENPDQASREAKSLVKGKQVLNEENLILYPVVSAPKKRTSRK